MLLLNKNMRYYCLKHLIFTFFYHIMIERGENMVITSEIAKNILDEYSNRILNFQEMKEMVNYTK